MRKIKDIRMHMKGRKLVQESTAQRMEDVVVLRVFRHKIYRL